MGVVAAAAAAVTVVAGCSNDDESEGTGTDIGPISVDVSKVDDIAAGLPQKATQAGKLVVGVNIPYSPNEFKSSDGKIIGFDVDIVNAVAKVLGVSAEYREADFAKIIPAVQAGTFDMGMSSFTDTKERERQVDFVTYYSAGVQWAQQKGKAIDPADACGKKVAVQADTISATDDVPGKSKACTDAGKPAISIQKYDSQDEATNALVLGKVDAMSADSPVTAYAIKKSKGKIEAAGDVFDSAPYGFPVAKGSPLAPALQKAVQYLIDNGQFKEIATHWGVEAGLIEKSLINGAIN
ncbi:MAG: ABC transporter substrate-binding protein [Gordonia amarae]